MSQKELGRIVRKRKEGCEWSVILPEIAQLRLSAEGSGIPIALKITKTAPMAVRIATEGEPAFGTIIKQEVNVWDKFNLSLNSLAEKVGLSGPRTLALIYALDLQNDPACFHRLSKGKLSMKGYSKVALDALREAVADGKADEAWREHGPQLSGRRKGKARCRLNSHGSGPGGNVLVFGRMRSP